jgi:hypothetical protein
MNSQQNEVLKKSEVHVNYTATIQNAIKSADKFDHTPLIPNLIKTCCMLSKIKYNDKHILPLVYITFASCIKNASMGIWAIPWN